MDERREVLVGRAQEWERLAGALDDVRGGSFRTVLIHGEAGIGKTRLVQELVDLSRRSDFYVFAGRSEDLDRMRPFGAIADGVAGFARGWKAGGSVARLLEELASLSNPLELIDRFVDLIEELALSHPTSVVLEDLHWADADTISAARALARRLAYLPILVVGTYRPHPQFQDLQRFIDVSLSEGASEIALTPLEEDALARLVEGIVGGRIGERLSKMLSSVAGNPLYALELANALQEEGSLRNEEGLVDAATTELPPTLRLTILRRLSQFPPPVVERLKRAAILGSTFHVHELAALCGQPVADVAGALEAPIAAGMIEDRGEGQLAFRHDLIHEAIYQDVPSAIRATMHVETARTMRSLGTAPARVAEQMTRGLELKDPALIDEVIPLMQELAFPAPNVAIALAEKALTIPAPSEERRDVIRRYLIWPFMMTGRREDARALAHGMLSREKQPIIAATIRLPAAMVLGESGLAREAIAELERMVDEISALDSPAKDARVFKKALYAREFTELVQVVRVCIAWLRLRAGMYDRVDIDEPFLKEARETTNSLTLPVAAGCYVAALLVQGRAGAAVHESERYLQLEAAARSAVPTPFVFPALSNLLADRLDAARAATRDGRRHASQAGETNPFAVYSAIDSLVAFLQGKWDDSMAEGTLGLELVHQRNCSPVMSALAHVAMSQVCLRRGDVERARSILREASALVSEKPQWGSELLGWSAALCIEATEGPARAIQPLLEAWDSSSGGHLAFFRPAFADLVRLAVATGGRELAEQVTEEAEEGRRRAEEVPSAVATALRCRGLLEDDAEKLAAAVEHYRTSPRVVERAGGCEDAADSLARKGSTTAARALFEEALGLYDDLEASHDSSRVLSRMRTYGMRRGSRAARRRPAIGWASLTPTEVQVAQLTVEGLTNPKIAQRLFISRNTVQTHLSHIFSKLGIGSRVELAALAAKQSSGAEP